MIERPSWADDPIGRAWWTFHVAHPTVYGMLLNFCDEWRDAKPGQKCGMKMLWERLRWEHAIGNVGGDFKLNNNYTSLYARYIMESSDRYAGMFDLRERRCEVVADKPDPPWSDSMFTGYQGCPDAPCQFRSECIASGDCHHLRLDEVEYRTPDDVAGIAHDMLIHGDAFVVLPTDEPTADDVADFDQMEADRFRDELDDRAEIAGFDGYSL